MDSQIVPLVFASLLIMAFAYFAYHRVYRYAKRNLFLDMNLSNREIRMSLDLHILCKPIPVNIMLMYVAFELCIPAVTGLFGIYAFKADRIDMAVLLGISTIFGLIAAFGGLYRMIKAL
ncbi:MULTISPECIES: hypothetical protein [Mesorhizobium]|uniref:hypothetical protein n=1 Tax=Mesorhizobium australicum TaxID=536018 RepID=UPI0003CE8E7C|nr:hypothetical protein X739_22670 [Mesorhizobium sp. LNHC220B00]